MIQLKHFNQLEDRDREELGQIYRTQQTIGSRCSVDLNQQRLTGNKPSEDLVKETDLFEFPTDKELRKLKPQDLNNIQFARVHNSGGNRFNFVMSNGMIN